MSNEVTDRLAGMLANAPASEQPKIGTGRGPTGRLRNFKSMNDEKLRGVGNQVEAEGDDQEALDAVRLELDARGLS